MIGHHSAPDRRTMYILFMVGFFAIFSTTISKNPVLPLFSQALGAGDAVIGLVAAVSPLAGILFSFPVGVLSDHLGKRRLLIVSGAIFLFAPLLYLFIADPLWLIPVRFFHGMATAILGPVIAAMIAVRFAEKKGEVLGQYSSATLIGRTLAPLVGGVIISFFVFYPGLIPYRMVYLAAAIAAVPVVVLILLYREETPGPLMVLPFSAFRRSFATFFANRRLRATALVDMATYFAFGAFETFLPLILLSRGMGAYQTGILFAVHPVCRPDTDHRGDKTILRQDCRPGRQTGPDYHRALRYGVLGCRYTVCVGIYNTPSRKFPSRSRHVACHGCDHCVRRRRCRERRDGRLDGGIIVHHGHRAFSRPPRDWNRHCR